MYRIVVEISDALVTLLQLTTLVVFLSVLLCASCFFLWKKSFSEYVQTKSTCLFVCLILGKYSQTLLLLLDLVNTKYCSYKECLSICF